MLIVFILFTRIACVSRKSQSNYEKHLGETFFIGTYTNKSVLAHLPQSKKPGKGIYSFSLDKKGELSFLSLTPVLNPAVLVIHPSQKVLYSITENIDKNGSIETFKIKENGFLIHQSTFLASGKSTCYLAVDHAQKNAIVVNYWDAFIDVVKLDENGSLKSHLQNFRHQRRLNSRQVLTREDHWSNRQVGPHAHSAHFWKNRVFIPDLGENAIFQYRYSQKDLLEYESIIPLEEGSGPRHMVIHEKLNIAYVSNELKSSVVIAKLDPTELHKKKPRFIPIQYVSTVPNDFLNTNYVSEIKMSQDGRFLYVSNRGHDSIATYKIHPKSGELKLLDIISTGGKFPRHFALSPSGKFLLVANQDSNSVNVFHRSSQSGLLNKTKHRVQVPTPNFIRFL